MIQIRAFQPNDEPQLPHFLAFAAHEANAQTALANPDLARYIESFGGDGDSAIVAHEGAEIVGIAWARLWTPDDRGFGWVDEWTPEIAVAVKAQFQNQGIGTSLIEALKEQLKAMGARQVSLNVRADSPAVRLYEKLGFEKIAGSEQRNRMGGESFSMLAPLR